MNLPIKLWYYKKWHQEDCNFCKLHSAIGTYNHQPVCPACLFGVIHSANNNYTKPKDALLRNDERRIKVEQAYNGIVHKEIVKHNPELK